MRTWLDLTDRSPIRFDLQRLRADLERIESGTWLAHYDKQLSQGWKAILLRSRNGDVSGPEAQRPDWDYSIFQPTPLVDELPHFRDVLGQFQCALGRVRIFKLLPGAGIDVHRDIGSETAGLAFDQVRLHLPLYTNDDVVFHVGRERIHMKVGRLYYVDFTKKHFVRNDGDSARIHLVMDMKVNDWLRQFFPALTTAERIEKKFKQLTCPIWWKLRSWWIFRVVSRFWSYYEGSAVQRLRHRVRS